EEVAQQQARLDVVLVRAAVHRHANTSAVVHPPRSARVQAACSPLRTKTSTRWQRNSAEACRSSVGSVAAAATRAASAKLSGVEPSSINSAASARIGVGP